MWSKELTKLSRKYFEVGGCNVKSENGKFGILTVDNENQKYIISLFDSQEILTFNSIDDLINKGWAVD